MGSTAKSGQVTVFGGWVFFAWAQKNVRWFFAMKLRIILRRFHEKQVGEI